MEKRSFRSTTNGTKRIQAEETKKMTSREQELKADMYRAKKDHVINKKQSEKNKLPDILEGKEWMIKEAKKNKNLGNYCWRLRK